MMGGVTTSPGPLQTLEDPIPYNTNINVQSMLKCVYKKTVKVSTSVKEITNLPKLNLFLTSKNTKYIQHFKYSAMDNLSESLFKHDLPLITLL